MNKKKSKKRIKEIKKKVSQKKSKEVKKNKNAIEDYSQN